MSGYVFDTGALIALEKPAKQPRLAALLEDVRSGEQILVSAGALAEAWRGSPRQARLALLIKRQDTTVVDISMPVAKAIGAFLGKDKDGDDVVDAHAVMLARHHGLAVVTSDPHDLLAIDPKLRLVQI